MSRIMSICSKIEISDLTYGGDSVIFIRENIIDEMFESGNVQHRSAANKFGLTQNEFFPGK